MYDTVVKNFIHWLAILLIIVLGFNVIGYLLIAFGEIDRELMLILGIPLGFLIGDWINLFDSIFGFFSRKRLAVIAILRKKSLSGFNAFFGVTAIFYLLESKTGNIIIRGLYFNAFYRKPQYLSIYRSIIRDKNLIINNHTLIITSFRILLYNIFVISVIELSGQYHFYFIDCLQNCYKILNFKNILNFFGENYYNQTQ